MKKRIFKFWIAFVSVFVLAWVLNFVWEVMHGPFLYNCCVVMSPERYVVWMANVAVEDGLLILGVYLFTALAMRSLFWIEKIERKSVLIFVAAALAVAVFIEYRALFLMDKWSYSEWMPTLFGIGVSPLVQLAVTGVVSVWVSKKIVY